MILNCSSYSVHFKKFCILYKTCNKNVIYLINHQCIASLPGESIKYCAQSTNPIIRKFRKMMDDMDDNKNKEFIYKTNFGSVRMDSQCLVDTVGDSPIINELNIHNLEASSEVPNTNYIDDVYFNSTVSHISSTEFAFPNLDTNSNNDIEDQKASDLNYVDQQYMESSSNENQNISNSYRTSDLEISDLNYIDKQIFNSYCQDVSESEKCNSNTILDLEPNLSINKTLIDDDDKLNRLYNFENSIMEDSENFVSIIDKPVHISDHCKSRDAIETQLLQLSEEYSDNFEKGNIFSQVNFKSATKPDIFYEDKTVSTVISNNNNNNSELSNNENKTNVEVLKNVGFPGNRSAFDYVKSLREEEIKSSQKVLKGEILQHEWYKKIILAIPSFSQHTQHDMVKAIKCNIIYNENGIVAISKPYGIPMHGGGDKKHDRLNIVTLLPLLADLLKEKELHSVHRLDMNTTGVMLLAKTEEMSDKLKRMFKEHLIKKSYLAIVKGIPSPMNGIIDIPIGEGKVDKYQRMVLRPDIPGFRGKSGESKKALTRYKVLSLANNCSLLEVNPITGVKHQVRVHLGFGINCPVLGDHKYSFLTKMAPQKLPGNTLERLGMKQSSVRNLPMHLHAFCISIPGLGENGREIFIKTGPPKFFKTSLKAIQLSGRRNRITNEYSDIIYGYE